MNTSDMMEVLLVIGALALTIRPLGAYMAMVYSGGHNALTRFLAPLERLCYRAIGPACTQEQTWKRYAATLLMFNGVGIVFLILLQMVQGALPLGGNRASLPFGLAMNTAVSFVTNTNWQAYSGEAVMGTCTQMLGLATQNFLSAATGMAVLVALARGLRNRESGTIGNYWTDLTRGVVYVLLPLSVVLAVALVAGGVVQSFGEPVTATTLAGEVQTIPLGPAASQIAIKQLGTNGGGYFGVNSAHPLENPTPWTNLLEVLAILLIPAAMPYCYGRMLGSVRQGWAITVAMAILLAIGMATTLWSEHAYGTMEGRELRFGHTSTAVWSAWTTAASNGAVNGMHDSMSPVAGLVQLFNMLTGEVIFGGVGSGMYGMVVFALLTVFIAGLMVGRTPEYLGKKIGTFEVQMCAIAVLAPSACILVFTAIAAVTGAGNASLGNGGPHGFTEMLYTFTSAAANNGSAFGGYAANTGFVNGATAFCMLVGRFGVILPVLAIAGGMSARRLGAAGSAAFPTDGTVFVVLLLGVIVIVGALTFLPALALGPIVEHMCMVSGRMF